MSTQTRSCECCRKQLTPDGAYEEVHDKARQVGWNAGPYDRDALCETCKLTCRLFTYPNGDHNDTMLIKATADGIELQDGYYTLDWEWVMSVFGKLKPEAWTCYPKKFRKLDDGSFEVLVDVDSDKWEPLDPRRK